MLAWLRGRSVCVGTIGAYLGLSQPCAQTLLDALAGIGVVDRRGELYTTSAAAALYCQALLEENPPATGG